MITTENFRKVLEELDFNGINGTYYSKHFDNEKLIYPIDKGFTVNDGTTSNFSHPENFVVFECVCRLLKNSIS